MGVFQKLDLWSITDELDKMIDYDYHGNEKDSLYWDYYSEQITEIAIIAADMYEEIEEIKSSLWHHMPDKKIEFSADDDYSRTAVSWFNTAACMLSDTDMTALLEHENIYYAGENAEKEKRIRALERLTKKQQMFLYTEVVGFIIRFLQLKAAFQVITATIQELDYHQSFVREKEGLAAPGSSYL